MARPPSTIPGLIPRSIKSSEEAWRRLGQAALRMGISRQDLLEQLLQGLGDNGEWKTVVVRRAAIDGPAELVMRAPRKNHKAAEFTVHKEPLDIGPTGWEGKEIERKPDEFAQEYIAVPDELRPEPEPAPPNTFKLNLNKQKLGLDGQYVEPLWKIGGKWQDDEGKELPLPLAKVLEKYLAEGKMELEEQP